MSAPTCVTCKNFRRERVLFLVPLGKEFDKCFSPTLGRDVIYGKPNWEYVRRQRGSYGSCGYTGRNWEPK